MLFAIISPFFTTAAVLFDISVFAHIFTPARAPPILMILLPINHF